MLAFLDGLRGRDIISCYLNMNWCQSVQHGGVSGKLCDGVNGGALN